MRWLVVTAMLSACRWGFDPVTADGSSQNDTPVGDGNASPYVSAVTADTPLAFYRFEGDLADELHMGPTGTGEGVVTYDQGVRGGRGLRFDGSSTRIVFGDAFPFADTSPFTLELWIAPEGLSDQVRRVLVRSAGTDGYQIYLGATFLLASRTGGGTEGSYASASPYPGAEGQLLHIVATFDGAESSLYANAVYQGGMTDPRSILGGAGFFVVGDSEPPLFFKFLGRLDELAVYDHVLTAERIAAHYAAGR